MDMFIGMVNVTITCGRLHRMVVHSFRRCSGRIIVSPADEEVDVVLLDLAPAAAAAAAALMVLLAAVTVLAVFVTRGGYRNADELCRRVLTTSNGQVTMAPTVPATLRDRRAN